MLGSPGANDANEGAFRADAMAHEQHAERRAHAEQDEPILGLGMVGIVDDQRLAVCASSKETRCLRRFARALLGSHEKRSSDTHYIVAT